MPSLLTTWDPNDEGYPADVSRESESGLPIEPVYGPAALSDWDPDERLGAPGEYPYTRGVYGSMYTGRPWTMRQYAGFGTATESNRRYHQLIEHGRKVCIANRPRCEVCVLSPVCPSTGKY